MGTYNKAIAAPVAVVLSWVIVEILRANDIVMPEEITLALQAAISGGLVYLVPNKSK